MGFRGALEHNIQDGFQGGPHIVSGQNLCVSISHHIMLQYSPLTSLVIAIVLGTGSDEFDEI